MAAALLLLLACAWLMPPAPAVATELRLGYVEYFLPGVDRKDVALAVELWAPWITCCSRAKWT